MVTMPKSLANKQNIQIGWMKTQLYILCNRQPKVIFSFTIKGWSKACQANTNTNKAKMVGFRGKIIKQDKEREFGTLMC